MRTRKKLRRKGIHRTGQSNGRIKDYLAWKREKDEDSRNRRGRSGTGQQQDLGPPPEEPVK
jgi:hypothetical protein